MAFIQSTYAYSGSENSYTWSLPGVDCLQSADEIYAACNTDTVVTPCSLLAAGFSGDVLAGNPAAVVSSIRVKYTRRTGDIMGLYVTEYTLVLLKGGVVFTANKADGLNWGSSWEVRNQLFTTADWLGTLTIADISSDLTVKIRCDVTGLDSYSHDVDKVEVEITAAGTVNGGSSASGSAFWLLMVD